MKHYAYLLPHLEAAQLAELQAVRNDYLAPESGAARMLLIQIHAPHPLVYIVQFHVKCALHSAAPTPRSITSAASQPHTMQLMLS